MHESLLPVRATVDPARFLGFDVTQGLREFPAMASQVLEQARTLAVLPGHRLLQNACAEVAGTLEGRIDVLHPDLHEMRDDARALRAT